MKRVKQRLAVLLCIAALCVLAPAALAAQPLDESENDGKVIIYFETCGGIPVVERTNADGKLSSLPTPIMEGYTFNGWFTDIVGGDAIVAGETVFSGEEATVYAQWSPIDQVPTEPTAPADTAAGILERHKGTILIVGGMLVLVAVGLAM